MVSRSMMHNLPCNFLQVLLVSHSAHKHACLGRFVVMMLCVPWCAWWWVDASIIISWCGGHGQHTVALSSAFLFVFVSLCVAVGAEPQWRADLSRPGELSWRLAVCCDMFACICDSGRFFKAFLCYLSAALILMFCAVELQAGSLPSLFPPSLPPPGVGGGSGLLRCVQTCQCRFSSNYRCPASG